MKLWKIGGNSSMDSFCFIGWGCRRSAEASSSHAEMRGNPHGASLPNSLELQI